MKRGKVRVAVIGCGAQGRNHLTAYGRDPDVDVAAVCDIDPSRLEQTASEFGVEKRFERYLDLLEDDRYDLVSVCTMPVSHEEVVMAAFASGANVLCEKPTAMNAAEARAMMRVAARAGKFLTVGFNMRFMPNARFLERFVAEGRLGHPVYTRAWTFATDIPWWGKHYVKAISGGGVLASTAVHILDLALWVAGNPRPVSASASMTRVFPKKRRETAPSDEAAASFDVEDVFSGHVRFADGSWMTLEGGWAWDRPDYSYSFEMAGDVATVQFEPLRVMAEQVGAPIEITPAIENTGSWIDGWLRSIEEEIADVVAAVREGREPLVRAEEALTVQALVDALYRSAETGREALVDLPDDGSEPA
jgi:predicted dehydrogenase